MQQLRLVEQFPPWVVYFISVAAVIVSVQIGTVVARKHARQVGADNKEPVGAVVGATLGLLAFMLAFTFGIATSRRDSKKELLLDEVNAIGTTYLRAALIPEVHRADVRSLLRRYAEIRTQNLTTLEAMRAAVQESKQIQEKLWAHAASLRDQDLKNPDIAALFVDSLNETIDLQTRRVTVSLYHIPDVIWLVLIALSVVSMAMVGYLFGLSGKGNWYVNGALAITFSLVIVLIADLDRVASGWLSINKGPMISLLADMKDE